jgi:cell division septation protein DedD
MTRIEEAQEQLLGHRPGRVILSVFATLAALAVFGGIVWYDDDRGESQFEMPVVLADSGPINSQPESPGGLDFPNQDAAMLSDMVSDYANLQVERLLPSPEAPPPAQTESVEAEAISEPEALVLADPPPETAPGPAGLLYPEAVSPLASAPQTAASTEPPPASAAPVAALPTEPPAAPSAATLPPPAASLPASSESPAPQVAVLPPATTPAGPYVVQLAALKSQDRARPAWGRLRKAHSPLLSERELATQEIDLGERGILYRVQAGYFPDRASALELCTALKARGQDCLVAKR